MKTPARPAMKTAAKHSAALAASGGISPYSELIPADDLEVIVAELTEALRPCQRRVARDEARRLAGCYPTFRPTNDWLGAIEDALAPAPCDLIAKAVEAVSESADFPPNKAQVRAAVRALTAKRRAALSRAQAMMREHERRASEAAQDADRQADLEAFRAKLAGRSPLSFICGNDAAPKGKGEL